MPIIKRLSDAPYRWRIDAAPLEKVANHEKTMPAGFIRKDGYGITAAARKYLQPLIAGEAHEPQALLLPELVLRQSTAVPAL